MSRVIKFRVWNPVGHEWLFPNDKMEDWFGGSSKAIRLWCYDDGVRVHGLSRESVVIEQFTSLLDKHGKEIYEGDIVKWFHGTEDIGEVTYVGADSWYINQAFWGLKVKRFNDVSPFQSDDTYEVIGNIHEDQS